MAQIVTITCDLGYQDPYLAMVKGKLFEANPNINIIDVSCNVSKHEHSKGGYALKAAIPYFPNGTIHLFAISLLTINTEQTPIFNSQFLISTFQNQIIIAPNNGLFSLLDRHFNDEVFLIDTPYNNSFYLRDLYPSIVQKIVTGEPLSNIGKKITNYVNLFELTLSVSEYKISGVIIYEDEFGNIITNITKDIFNKMVGQKSFEIQLPFCKINQLSNSFNDAKLGDVICFFNAQNLLEIGSCGQPLNTLILTHNKSNRMNLEKYKIDTINIDII